VRLALHDRIPQREAVTRRDLHHLVGEGEDRDACIVYYDSG